MAHKSKEEHKAFCDGAMWAFSQIGHGPALLANRIQALMLEWDVCPGATAEEASELGLKDAVDWMREIALALSAKSNERGN